MPPDMAINMRRSKLKPEEAALLAGEVNKPTWESRNEGIHERVSFEDAIWGFDLAGGSFYKTPLRVVDVKPDSRAEKAGIRKGDKLLRINDIDTSTLTIQEAHKIIIDSGVHLKIAVTAPDDDEDAYFCYEDPLESGYDSEEERRIEKEKAKKREVHAKVSSYWSLQWPWVSKRRIIYRESNCFMVPSKYEVQHRDKFSPQPFLRPQEDIVLDSIKSEIDAKKVNEIKKVQKLLNSTTNGNFNTTNSTNQPIINGDLVDDNDTTAVLNGNHEIPEVSETLVEESQGEEMNSLKDVFTDETSHSEDVVESEKDYSQNDISVDDSNVESSEIMDSNIENSELTYSKEEKQVEEQSEEILETEQEETTDNSFQQDEDMINEVLNGEDDVSKGEEENVIDSILSDHEEMNSHSDER